MERWDVAVVCLKEFSAQTAQLSSEIIDRTESYYVHFSSVSSVFSVFDLAFGKKELEPVRLA